MSPSTVRSSQPSACGANIVHDLTVLPSRTTVQAPQWLVSQPTWVPVSPKTSRMKCTSRRRGSTSACRSRPLTLTPTNCFFAMPVLRKKSCNLFAGPFERTPQGASRQLPYQAFLVLRRAPQIGARLCFVSSHLRGLPDVALIQLLAAQEGFCVACFQRSRTDVGEANAYLPTGAAGIQTHLGGDRRRGKVSHLALQLEVGAPAVRRRQGNANLRHNLVRLQCGGEQGHEEVLNRNQ